MHDAVTTSAPISNNLFSSSPENRRSSPYSSKPAKTNPRDWTTPRDSTNMEDSAKDVSRPLPPLHLPFPLRKRNPRHYLSCLMASAQLLTALISLCRLAPSPHQHRHLQSSYTSQIPVRVLSPVSLVAERIPDNGCVTFARHCCPYRRPLALQQQWPACR